MNSFTLEILEGGVWKNPTAVFPFTVGELLDERLDEGNVVFFSSTPEYKPLTEVRISFFKNGEPDYDASGSNVEYFITANDNAVEYPSGSGRYKHEIYLIERMKLTEGILCPSLTFTNSLPFTVQTVGNRVEPQITADLPEDAPIPDFKGYGGFYSPIKSGYTFVAPSVYEQQKSFLSSPIPSGYLLFSKINSGYTVRLNGAVIQSGDVSYDLEEQEWHNLYNAIEIDGSVLTGGTLEVIYTIRAHHTAGQANYTYTVSYTMSVTDVIALRPYSITDCVCRVLEEAEPLEFRTLPRFEFDGVLRNIIHGDITGYAPGSQAEKYSKIRAPEFTLTQSTLREQLRAIGGFIHAEPYIDEDNTVYFLEYGNTAVDGIEGTPYISHTRKWDINQYCTEIRSNAQNLTSSLGFAKGAKIEPLSNAYRSLRVESGYNRVNEQNGMFDTDEPVYEINSVKIGLLAGDSVASGWATIGSIVLRDLDITPYIVEQTVYDSNLYPTGSWPFSRTYALYYTMGGKGIKGLFYQPEVSFNQGAQPFAIANIIATVASVDSQRVHNLMTAVFGDTPPVNLVFNITYKPISSALVSHGKQTYTEGEARYTLIYNQSDNLVETEYYGEHLKGVAARLGNVEVERTFLLSSRRAIPKIGYTIDGYSISAVSCEYMPKYIKCTVGLAEFNRISEYVGINSLKRMYEISERQSQERSVLINRTCLITENPYESSEPDRIFEVSGFINAINEYRYEEGNAGLYEDEIVTSALVTTKKKQTLEEIATVLLPVTARSFGNTVHFSFGMKDNYSAGARTEWVEEADISGRWQKDVPYADLYGRAWWLSFGLVTRAYTPINTAFSLPATDGVSVSETTLDNIGEDVRTVAYTHRLRKDSRECIRYNVEVDYKTDVDGLIIGSGLAARCRYLNNYEIDRPHIYITSRDISKLGRTFDYDASTDRRADTSGDIVWHNRGDHIELSFSGLIGAQFKYWVICSPISTVTERYVDEGGTVVEETVVKGGEIILAGKIPKLNGLTVKNLYFVIK